MSAKLRVSLFNHVLFDTLHAFFSPYHKDLISLVEELFLPACKDLETRAILLHTDNGHFFSLLFILFLCPQGGTPFNPHLE